jgi:hypothetical protein
MVSVLIGLRKKKAADQNPPAFSGVGHGAEDRVGAQHHVNLRADIAQGRNGHTFGMGIGEAF